MRVGPPFHSNFANVPVSGSNFTLNLTWISYLVLTLSHEISQSQSQSRNYGIDDNKPVFNCQVACLVAINLPVLVPFPGSPCSVLERTDRCADDLLRSVSPADARTSAPTRKVSFEVSSFGSLGKLPVGDHRSLFPGKCGDFSFPRWSQKDSVIFDFLPLIQLVRCHWESQSCGSINFELGTVNFSILLHEVHWNDCVRIHILDCFVAVSVPVEKLAKRSSFSVGISKGCDVFSRTK